MYTSYFATVLTLQTFEETTYRLHNLAEKSGWYAVQTKSHIFIAYLLQLQNRIQLLRASPWRIG